MRNYRFAILPYRPADEFKLRKLMRRLDRRPRGARAGASSPSRCRSSSSTASGRTGDASVERAHRPREAAASSKRPGARARTPPRDDRPAHRGPRRHRRRRRAGSSTSSPTQHPDSADRTLVLHRPGRRALPVLPLVGAAQAHRRQDPEHPGGAALPGRARATRRRSPSWASCPPTATTAPASIRSESSR